MQVRSFRLCSKNHLLLSSDWWTACFVYSETIESVISRFSEQEGVEVKLFLFLRIAVQEYSQTSATQTSVTDLLQ